MRGLIAVVGIVACAGAAQADSPFNWTGLYIGAHAGYGWSDVSHAQTNGGMPYGPFDYETDGGLAGVTLGYNLQMQAIVIGIEVEGGWMDLSGEGRIASSNPAKYQVIDVDGGAYGLIAGRLGFTLDRTLIYGKGGYAWMDGDAGQKTTNPGFVTHRSEAFEGLVYGGGVEHKLSPHLSIRLEYLRFDFDTVAGDQESISDPPIGYVYTNKTDLAVDTVRVGLNYSFGAD